MFKYLIVFTLLSALPISAKITTELLASGFKNPVWAEAPKGEKEHLWVVEKKGTIHLLHKESGKKQEVLDITKLIEIRMNELVLLGLAFIDDYLRSGRFYVY